MTKETLTQEELKEILSYDPEIGIFHWKKVRSNRLKVGDTAGWNAKKKWGTYRAININGRCYYAHRLVFLYITGKFPPQMVDHRDRDGLNNKFSNLRCCTPSENNVNQKLRKDSKTGVKGVTFYPRDKTWSVSISFNGVNKFLGRYKDKQEAIRIRKQAEKEHGFHLMS